jgi:hypothetical protein
MIFPGETAMHVTNPDIAGDSRDLFNFDKEAAKFREQQTATLNLKKPWYERVDESFTAVDSAAE